MPCDQVRVNQIVFKADNAEILKSALERAGFRVVQNGKNLSFTKGYLSGSFQNNQFNVQEGIDVDEVKREYAKVSLELSAKKFGWAIVKTADNKLKLRRAY